MTTLKVIMDSGTEYVIESEKSLKDFIGSLQPPKGVGIYYVTLSKGIIINTSKVTCVEELEEAPNE